MKVCNICLATSFGITVLICAILIARQLPFSPFFSYHGNHVDFVRLLLEENKIRVMESKRYLKEYKDHIASMPQKSMNISYNFVVLIVTMNSDTEKGPFKRQIFLPQTISGVLKELNNSGNAALDASGVILCNVNFPPQINHLAIKFSNFIETVERNSAGMYKDLYDKEKEDYRFCLEQASSKYKPNYILVLEDDVFIKPGAMSTLSYVIANIKQHKSELKWLSIKLYHPKKWLGYSNEISSIIELLATSLVLGSLVSLALRTCKEHCGIESYHVYYTFFIILSMVACLIFGRQNVILWRSLFHFTHSLTRAQGCCTQAVLYNNAQVPLLLRYLSKVQCSESMPVDLALDKFAGLYDLKQYMVEPNLCSHIGFLSTFDKDSHKAIDFL